MKAKKEREIGLIIVFSVIAVGGIAAILAIVVPLLQLSKEESLASYKLERPSERVVTSATKEPSPELRTPVPQEDVEALKREIASLRGEVTTLKERIEISRADIRARDEVLAELRQEKTRSLADEFLKRSDVLKLSDSVRNWIMSQIIPRLEEVPNEWEVEELASAMERVFPRMSEASSAWLAEIGKPNADPRVVADLLAKKEAVITEWNGNLLRIFGQVRGKRCLYSDKPMVGDVIGGR